MNYISDKSFDKYNFTQSHLQKGEYENCVFGQCDFSNSDLSEIRFIDCEFKSCDLSMAKISKTSFRDVKFKECKMLGLENVFSIMLNEFKPSYDSLQFARWRPVISSNFSLLLNIVAALFLSQDIKAHKVKTKYVILTTVLFRPVGIFVFLLFLFYQDKLVIPADAGTDDSIIDS
jgi:hypothetical protein